MPLRAWDVLDHAWARPTGRSVQRFGLWHILVPEKERTPHPANDVSGDDPQIPEPSPRAGEGDMGAFTGDLPHKVKKNKSKEVGPTLVGTQS
eukprot:878563-Pyramimonas_sp.AAC.1